MMQQVIVAKRSMRAYIIRVDVEFLHDGQELQQRPQAALPQQQASWAKLNTPRTAPMGEGLSIEFDTMRETRFPIYDDLTS